MCKCSFFYNGRIFGYVLQYQWTQQHTKTFPPPLNLQTAVRLRSSAGETLRGRAEAFVLVASFRKKTPEGVRQNELWRIRKTTSATGRAPRKTASTMRKLVAPTQGSLLFFPLVEAAKCRMRHKEATLEQTVKTIWFGFYNIYSNLGQKTSKQRGLLWLMTRCINLISASVPS